MQKFLRKFKNTDRNKNMVELNDEQKLEDISKIIINDISTIINYDDDQILEISKYWSVDELKIIFQETNNKESEYNTAQMVAKILMNSLYGALGNVHFPLFNEDIACAITGAGRYFIRKLAKYIEDKLQSIHKSDKLYVVYGDTDSIYFHIEPFMEAYITKNPNLEMNHYVDIANKFEIKIINPIVKKCILDFTTDLNANNSSVVGANREIIADSAIFCAKKQYFARVRDNEGTRYPDDRPKIKVMGMKITQGGTAKWSKKKLKEAIPILLDYEESQLKEWLAEIRNEFTKVPLSEIVSSEGVSRLDYVLGEKGIPIGARSALVYNKYINAHKLENTYPLIVGGDKTKRLRLREPNPYKSNIIGFLSDNFGNTVEREYVDYDIMYEKNFMKPLENMTNCLKYKIFQETQEIDEW